jgi:hypothetical protein
MAQALLCGVASHAVHEEPSVVFDAMIDNVRFASDDLPALERVWRRFLEACAYIGIRVGDKSAPSQNAYDHLGTHVTLDRTVTLTDKFKLKLTRATAAVARNHTSEWRDVQSAFGRLVFALTVVGIPLGYAYFVFKYIRRRSRLELKPHEDTPVWQRSKEDWVALVDQAIRAEFRFIPIPTRECTMFTDASTDGWGVVIFDLNNSMTVFGARWSPDERELHINRLEQQALKIGFRWVAQIKPRGHLLVRTYVDNTTTIGATTKLRSNTYNINMATLECEEVCRHAEIIIDGPHYVPSRFNYADAPSRIFDFASARRRVHEQLSEQLASA